jgi:hypothetical protein
MRTPLYLNVVSEMTQTFHLRNYFCRPGRKLPIHYYVCTDIDPAVDAHLPSSYGYIDALSILLHIIIKIRIVFYCSQKPKLCCFQIKVKKLCWIAKTQLG